MKKLFRSNKILNSFSTVLSAPLGDESKKESLGPILEIKISNPLENFSGNFSGHRVAGA